MTCNEIQEVLRNIEYTRHDGRWHILLHYDTATDRPFLQVQCRTKHQEASCWTGRKWMLSPHMTRTEIVYTAFKAIMAAEEHEIRENFFYKKALVCGPHVDVEAIADALNKGEIGDDVRPDAMQGETET